MSHVVALLMTSLIRCQCRGRLPPIQAGLVLTELNRVPESGPTPLRAKRVAAGSSIFFPVM